MSARPKLRAVAPKAAEPQKPKILVSGKPGVGKTWVSLEWPSVYYIDTEGGANLRHYTEKLARAGGVYFGPDQGALDPTTVIEQIQALATEQHPYRTLVIDSVSQLWNNIIAGEQARLGDKDGFGASKKPAKAFLRQMVLWANKLDMNVIFVCHEKDVWGDSGKIGVTYDADEKLEYQLHLSLNVQKVGARRFARVGKNRLEGFQEGETFDWTFDAFADRYGRSVIERDATPIMLASEDQVSEVKRLLDTVKLPDGQEKKWLDAASADRWEDVEAEKIVKTIEFLKGKIAA